MDTLTIPVIKTEGEDNDNHVHNDSPDATLKNYTGVLHIDWKSHLLWTLSIICFILSRLWWLIPLPGDSYLPPYRTYPGTFLNHFFLTLACTLASRSLPVALINIPFTNGVHPNLVIEYGTTGGYSAMWNSLLHRSGGIRYFLIAFLVTACILLGNALEGELQSSTTINHKVSPFTTPMPAVVCQHATSNDYQAASDAYSKGLITNTLSDVSSRFLSSNSSALPHSISLVQTHINLLQDISTQKLAKRNHNVITRCLDEKRQTSPNNTLLFTIQNTQFNFTINDFNSSSQLMVIRNTADNNSTFYTPYTNITKITTTSKVIPLNVRRYVIPGGDRQAILIYSSPIDNIVTGISVSSKYSNYTCQWNKCYPIATKDIQDTQPIADTIVQSIQSNVGLYGTSIPESLVLNILNNQSVYEKSKLIDALYMNPNCPEPIISSGQGYLILPYSAAHWTTLALIWVFCFILLWLLGVYLIGYSEASWSHLARTGHLIPQIIHNSGNLFRDGNSGLAVLNQPNAYLNQATGKMTFNREHNHGYSVTDEVLSIANSR